MDAEVSFGLAVRAARTKAALSQEGLAEAAELHRTYISDIERGLRNPSLTTIIRLAEALDLDLSELVSFHRADCSS